MAPAGAQKIEDAYRPGSSNNTSVTNAAPITSDIALTTSKNVAASSTLLGTDSNSDALVYSVVSAPSHGSVTITNTATGAFTYTPDSNFSGSDSFTYKVNDGSFDSNISTVSVTVNNTATAPVATNITPAAFNEDVQSGFITLSYTDPNGDLATSCILSNLVKVTETTVCSCDGAGVCKVKVTGTANANGAASFSYTVDAGGETSNTASAAFTITAVNDAPTLTSVSTIAGGSEEASVTISYAALSAAANEADVEGDTLSFRVEAISTGTLTKGGVAVTAGTTLLSNGGSLVWTPAANANGTLNAFTIKAYDGTTVSSSAIQVQVSVSAVNDAPTLTSLSTLTGATEDTALTISYANLVAASDVADVDGDTLSFRVETVSSGILTKGGVAITAGTTLLSTGESLVWTPAANANGTLNAFTVKAYDGTTVSSSAIHLQVTVAAANDAPTMTSVSTLSGGTEDTSLTISYATLAAATNAADVDGDTLSFRVEAVSSGTLTKGGVAVTAGSTLIASGESLVWTPAANANGTLNAFTIKAYDGTAPSSTAIQVQVSVSAASDAPTLTSIGTLTGGVEDTGLSISYGALRDSSDAADVDGDAISFRVEAVSTGTLTKGGVAVTAGTTLLSSGESLVWTPAANATGTLNAFTVKAYDGTSASTSAIQVQASFSAVNDTPSLARNNTLTLKAAATVTITAAGYLSVTDVDNTTTQIIYTVGSAPTHGSLKKSGTTLTTSDTFTQDDVDNNRITYVHGSSTDTVLDSFTFTVSDGSGGSISSSTFNITPVVAPQTLTRTSPSLTPGSSTSVSVKAVGGSISSGRVVKFYKDSSCAAGQFGSDATTDGSNEASATGSLSVDGAYSFYATVTLNSVVSDCSPGAGAANYVLDTANPTAPTGLARLTPAGATGTSATPTLRLSGGDVGGVGITAKVYSDNTCATLAGTGSINSTDVTLDTITSGAHTYYAKLFDEAGNASSCSTANVSYTLNQTPTISDTTNETTNEDTVTSAIAFTVGDAETAAGSLTVTATSSNQTVVPDANLTFGGSGANRTVTITPAANQNGTATITLTVSDGFSSVSDTFVLTVTAVNDAPTLTTISNLSTTTDTALTIQYSDLATAANEADVDGDAISFRVEAVSTGTLTKGGTSVTAGTTLLSSGESLVWTPASGATGALNAFMVKAYDGTAASATAVQVVVDTAAGYTDSDDTSTGFGSGTKVGVAWNTSTTNKLILAPDTNCDGNMGEGETTYTNCAELDESWTPQYSSIKGYWRFNNVEGNIPNASTITATIGPDATTSNANSAGMAYVNGHLRQGVSLDGTDGIIVADTPTLRLDSATTTTWTIAGWIYPTAFSSYSMIYCYSFFQACLGIANATKYLESWSNNASSVVGTIPIPLNTWTHVALSNNGTSRTFYVNGVADVTRVVPTINTSNASNGIGTSNNASTLYSPGAFFGTIDEIAVWHAALSPAEVQNIYSRQSAKYSGMLTSRVFDQGSSQIWDGLSWLTNLPFGKELPGDADASGTITSADSETHLSYPLIVGSTGSTSDDNLMNGILGLWHMNESSWSGTSSEVKDAVSSKNPATSVNATTTLSGQFGRAGSFSGTNSYVATANTTTLNPTSSISIQAWVYPTATNANNGIVNKSVLGSGSFGDYSVLTSSGSVYFRLNNNGAQAGISGLITNQWNHIVATYDGSNLKIYLNTAASSPAAYSSAITSSNSPLQIGAYYTSGYTFIGKIDEVAIWSRALNVNEVKQLYRRGTNRLKFQVRTCIDVACNCQAYGTSGTTSDCDGDTIVNASDSSDSYKAIWRGSDGTSGTYFSELHNKDLYDSTANCGLSDLVLPGSPDLLFSCFSPSLSSSVLTNRYFQYRTILESDDASTNCNYGSGATWCSPELRSVEVVP